ncbi:MAG: hypothetical protein SOZ84_10945 [Treponema sp.]|jgi:hypothetical protein|nr:hypothetical protein [Treponema sp.]
MENENLQSESNTEEKFLDKFFKDSTFIVFLIPLYAFLITYCIEMGYAKYYDIPFSVIQIDGRNVCYNFIKIMLIFICIYGIEAFLSNIFSPFFRKYKNKNLRTMQMINYFFIEIISLILLANVILCNIRNIYNLVLIILLLLFVFSFFYNQIKRTRFEKRSDYEDLKKESDEIDYAMNLRFIGNFLGKKTLFLLFITFILISISLTLGEKSAEKQTVFYKINDREDIVGVVIYGDRIIAKGFVSQKLENKIIFLDISNETQIEILPLNAICKKEIIQEENASEENP